jgi:hypothetical protein
LIQPKCCCGGWSDEWGNGYLNTAVSCCYNWSS